MQFVKVVGTNGKYKVSTYNVSAIFMHKEGENLKDMRCPFCKQLLLKAEVIKGEIKCPRCKKIIKLDYSKDRA